jgi:outer membrane receptor protein involved in Fe transport
MLLALLLTLSMAATTVSGVVKDANGGAVPGASVAVRTQSGAEDTTITGPDGRFSIDTNLSGQMILVVKLEGFAEKQIPVAAGDMDVVLEPARIAETVIVTAGRTEQRLGNVPASVNVLTRESVRTSPAVVADDVLRQVPSFSLFRRTSSLVAQPTTQGVSLRGIGPSGVSRTLVLFDGIPVNDPFGGWVYWTRVPLMSVEQIEITEDAASSLYGNYAMGGVINILTARPTRRTIEARPQYGNHNTPKFDFFASDRWNNVGAAIEGSVLDTDGFPIVAENERGPIDNNASVTYNNLTGKVEYDPSARLHATVRASRFSEDRSNAKIGEVNDTLWTAASGSVRALMPDNSTLQGQLFFDNSDAHFTFLAVPNGSTTRDTVRLTVDQRVPVTAIGGAVQWSKIVGTKNVFTAGVDLRRTDGDSEEDVYGAVTPAVPGPDGVTLPSRLVTRRIAGGTQRSVGAFVSNIYTPTNQLVLTLSARADSWTNYQGHRFENSVSTGLPTANNADALPDKSDTALSPRVAALYHVNSRLTGWAAFNSGFRAPSLNELYRQFSIGLLVTRANDQLGPERLLGGEAGVNVALAQNLTARATWFDNRVKNPVSNITIGTNLQQRQNLGRTRIHGVQSDVEYRFTTMLRVTAGYIYNQAKVTDGGVENADLVGKYLAQVPVHRGSFQVSYTNPKYVNLAIAAQFAGLQYNDDQNQQSIPGPTQVAAGYDDIALAGLPGYATWDATASRNFGRNLQVFFGVQNLTDAVYFVQTNPSTTGTPRLFNGGVRIRWSGR